MVTVPTLKRTTNTAPPSLRTFFNTSSTHNIHKPFNNFIGTSTSKPNHYQTWLTLGKIRLPSVLPMPLEPLTDTNLKPRRKDFSDKAEETLKPDSQKSLFDKTKESVTDAGKAHFHTSLPGILLT